MPELIVEQGSDVRRETIAKREVLIGRDDDCDITLDGGNVSRHHARIRLGANGWMVEDLDSVNGTFVGEDKIVRAAISRGDAIRVSEYTITFLGGDDVEPEIPPNEPERPRVGSVPPEIDGLVFDAVLDRGVLTDAFRFVDGTTHRPVVVRALREPWTSNELVRTWFGDAIRAWESFDHPSLAPIHRRVASDPEMLCFSESAAEEGTLSDRLRQSQKMSQTEAADFVLAVSDGVAELHAYGVVHGGIRPTVIWLSRGGVPRLVGPGLSRDVIAAVDDDHARELAGIPPESVTPEGVIGRRSDIFSLGALLFQLASGSPAIEGRTADAARAGADKGLRRPAAERLRAAPVVLTDFLDRACALDPTDRPLTVEDFAEELREVKKTLARRRPGVATELTARQVEEPTPEMILEAKRRKRLSWAITIFIFILLQAGAVVLLKMDFFSKILGKGGD